MNVELIKDNLEKSDIEINQELKDRFENQSEKPLDNLFLGKIFIECFDFLKVLDNPDLSKYLNKYSPIYSELTKEFSEYGNGLDFGDWAIEERIKNCVFINRYSILKFINLFKEIFL